MEAAIADCDDQSVLALKLLSRLHYLLEVKTLQDEMELEKCVVHGQCSHCASYMLIFYRAASARMVAEARGWTSSEVE